MRPIATALITATTLATTGCYERIVHRSPGLLDSAIDKDPRLGMLDFSPTGVGNQAPDTNWGGWLPPSPAEVDATPDENDPLRLTTQSGKLILVRRAPAHVIHHLINAIRDEEWELIYDQLLADKLLESYVQRGRDPRDALAYIQSNADEILEVLRAMPNAETTPGVTMRLIGQGQFQLIRAGGYRNNGKFWAIEVSLERSRFALSMLYKNAPRRTRRW